MVAHLTRVESAPPAERGRWGKLPPETPAGAIEAEPAPLTWEPELPLAQRIRRAVSLPAAIGVLVFVAAVVATAWFMLRAPADEVDAHTEVAAAAPANATVSGGAVIVHVVGEIEHPGVVELDAGARVREAIEAAGGATSDAILAGVNLARPLVDGEQIIVPGPNDVALEPIGITGQSGQNGAVNLNRATVADLEQLSGIGPALAQRIIDWRDANGAFTSVDQLLEVSGIGEKTLARFRDGVTV